MEIGFWLLIVLVLIHPLGMYIFDALIAFYIPAKRVEKRLSDPNTIGKLSGMYGRGVYKAVKPDLERATNKLLDKINTKVNASIESVNRNVNRNMDFFDEKITININDVKSHINKQITNHIPTMIDTRLQHFQNEIQNQLFMQIDGLRNALYRNMGSQGAQARSNKAQERLLLESTIIQADPSLEQKIYMGKMLRKNKIIDTSIYDQGLSLMMFKLQRDGKLGSKGIGTMPLFPGSLPHVDESFETVRQAPQEDAIKEQTSPEDQIRLEHQLRQDMTDRGVPQEVQDMWIAQGKRAQKQEKEEKESKLDGKKETWQEKEDPNTPSRAMGGSKSDKPDDAGDGNKRNTDGKVQPSD